MVAIIDYGVGNLFSLKSSLKAIGADVIVTADKEELKKVVKLLKIGIIAYVSYSYLQDKWQNLYVLYGISLKQSIGLIGEMVADLGIRIAIVYMIIVFADYA